jgi:glucose-6-phosphate isomerase
MEMLRFDPSGAYVGEHGLHASQVTALLPRLHTIREAICGPELEMLEGKRPIPAQYDPLDAAFFPLPDKLLAEYQTDRKGSELGRIFKLAHQLHAAVDRVVVLGIGGSYMGAKALMESCCQPFFNELSRGDRGSKPRMYFEGNNVDNDASQGLLHLLGAHHGKVATDELQRWALVVISKSGGTLETAAALRQFMSALEKNCGGDTETFKKLLIPVTGETGKLRNLANELKVPETFPVPDGVGGRFSVLSAVGLVPAAILGLDVVKLLEGAAAMNKHFREAPPEENIVLQYVAVNHLLETLRGCNVRILSVWSKALESAGLWYDQLLAESLGKDLLGAMPLTTVNTRDLHSRHQQHQQGRRDKVINNVIVDKYRFDPLPVGRRHSDPDSLNDIAEKTLPDIMKAAIEGTNEALRSDGRPTTNLFMPRIDETFMGQFFQMMMLATVVEGRLLGMNPYGQPGVESYKKNMSRLLGRK